MHKGGSKSNEGKQQDFRTEKYIRYGIRKYSFSAASVAIAAGLMFLELVRYQQLNKIQFQIPKKIFRK